MIISDKMSNYDKNFTIVFKDNRLIVIYNFISYEEDEAMSRAKSWLEENGLSASDYSILPLSDKNLVFTYDFIFNTAFEIEIPDQEKYTFLKLAYE